MCAIRSSFFSLVIFFSLVLFGQAGCSSDQPMVEVTVSGLPDGAAALSIDATLGGAALDGDRRTVQPADSTFDVRLATGSTGTLVLKIGAVNDSGCQIAYGEATVEISGPGTSYVSATLSSDTQYLGCRLILQRSGTGSGKVTIADSTGATVDCDFSTSDATGCDLSYSVSRKLTLTALAESGSYFAGWTGECDGVSSCSIQINQRPLTVKVGLLPTKLCNGNFCWEHPLPQGNALNALHGQSTDDIWMVGEAGTIAPGN